MKSKLPERVPSALSVPLFGIKKLKKSDISRHGRVTGCSLEQLRLLQLAFREKTIPITDQEALELLGSREWGASQAVIKLATSIGLNKFISSRRDSWVDYVMAMIVGRLVFQGSKLSLCNLWEDTGFWELCGLKGKPKVKACYEAMDILLSRQKHIQKKLFARHMKEGSLILYDITSSYFEGEYEQSELVKFGYNRDQKKGHDQAVIGLVCTQEGIPVACEVFAGNTKDESTVVGKIDSFRKDYGLDHFVFMGDRGMITQGQFERIHATENLVSCHVCNEGMTRSLFLSQQGGANKAMLKHRRFVTTPLNEKRHSPPMGCTDFPLSGVGRQGTYHSDMHTCFPPCSTKNLLQSYLLCIRDTTLAGAFLRKVTVSGLDRKFRHKGSG